MPVRAESYIQTLEGRVETVESAVTAIGNTYTEAEVNSLLAAKAPTASPTFTGTVTIPDGALAIADTSGLQTALDAKAPATGKLYLKDTQGTPHYWQVTVSNTGVLTTADVGTTLPTDGFVGVPA